jgi:hypothetical protein
MTYNGVGQYRILDVKVGSNWRYKLKDELNPENKQIWASEHEVDPWSPSDPSGSPPSTGEA